MIEFRWNRVDKRNNNTPIISDAEIDELAEIILGDYKPQLLQEPRKVKYEHFLESYLGANLDYRHIYYEEDEGRILGVTSFNNREKLPVFDREKMCLDTVKLKKNSIVLDFYVTEEGREGLELFTGLHEGGHLWMHQGVYARNEMQMSLFGHDAELKPVTCCRRTDIENFGRKGGYRTAEQWREHHADLFFARKQAWEQEQKAKEREEQAEYFKQALTATMGENGDLGVTVPDYVDENVSTKVVKIIQSYTGIVNRMVWRK